MVRRLGKRRNRGLYKRKAPEIVRKARRALRAEEATAKRLAAGEVKNKRRTSHTSTRGKSSKAIEVADVEKEVGGEGDGILRRGETEGFEISESVALGRWALGELIKARLLSEYNNLVAPKPGLSTKRNGN